MTEEYEKPLEVLRAPSVYDASLNVLHRSGLVIPGDVIEWNTSVRHQPRPEIEVAWGHVYSRDGYRELRALGDALFAVGDGYATYKHLHLLATRRAFGMRPGYYGKPADSADPPHTDVRPGTPTTWTFMSWRRFLRVGQGSDALVMPHTARSLHLGPAITELLSRRRFSGPDRWHHISNRRTLR
ncbi:hypothetical protein ACH5AO_23890 [Streptomyces sp. NPDC018964]|uniref:hypothetical protein n=1 Tax=unclassified Streptomyces TaxID=2593676 RepID=UPI0037BBF928